MSCPERVVLIDKAKPLILTGKNDIFLFGDRHFAESEKRIWFGMAENRIKKTGKVFHSFRKTIIDIDDICLHRKVYLIIAIFLVVLLNFFLSDSFTIEKSVSNYANSEEVSVNFNSRSPILFTFTAAENDLSSLYIYKNMTESRLSSSDKASVRIERTDGEVIFETEVYLYHSYRTYITVNCGNLRVQKGEVYRVNLSVQEMASESVCYLRAHVFNDFSAPIVQDVENILGAGFQIVPNVTQHYRILNLGYMIGNQCVIMATIILPFIPFLSKKTLCREIMRAVLTPFYIYLLQEILNISKPYAMQVIFPFSTHHYFVLLGGISIFILLYLLLYAILGTGTLAMLITVSGGVIIGYVNHFKILMRGDPAVPWDVFSAGIAAKISTNYSFFPTTEFYNSFLLLLIMLIILRVTYTKPRRGIKKRILPIFLFSGAFAGLLFGVILNRDLLKRLDINYSLFPPLQSYNENGTMMAIALNLNHFFLRGEEIPEGENIHMLIHEYEEEAAVLGLRDNLGADMEKPNVICIMSESFSDLRRLRTIETDQEVMPFYDSILEESMDGDLAVSVFGGSTCNTEFEFLTGYSVRNLLTGSSVYSLYIKNSLPAALPNIFRENGYETLAVHPFDGAWWGRSDAYPLLGFDRFLTQEDFADPEKIRDYISDREAFQRVVDEFEDKERDAPLFTFLVTMQNHADFTHAWEDKKYNIKIENFPGHDFPSTENYLSLLRESDDALRDFIEHFRNVDQPTLIVFFGDHKAFLDTDLYSTLLETELGDISLRECVNLYTTPYFVWANYSLPLEDQAIISPNFLGQRILDLSGIPSPEERSVLQVLQTEIAAVSAVSIYDREKSFFTSIDTLPENIRKRLSDYAAIQYEGLFPSEN